MAQASQAAPYFDYDWVLERAREYDRLDRYLGLQDQAMQDLCALSGSAAANDIDEIVSGVQRFFGRLDVLVQLREGLQGDMEAYLGGSGRRTKSRSSRRSRSLRDRASSRSWSVRRT